MFRKLSILPLALCLWGCDPGNDVDDIDEASDRQATHEEAMEDHIAQVFEKLDADQNGTLSPAEVKDQWIGHALEKGDADGDGELSSEELVNLKKAHHEGGCGHGDCQGECPHAEGEGKCSHGEGEGECSHGEGDGECPHGGHGGHHGKHGKGHH